MTNKAKKIPHKGGCHCGAVSFEIMAPKRAQITMCNCSLCAACGYQHLFVAKSDFKLLSSPEALTTYTFNTKTAKHTFCKTCGVKSFYTPRSHPHGLSINYRCLDQSGFTMVRYSPFDGQHWEENIRDLKRDQNV